MPYSRINEDSLSHNVDEFNKFVDTRTMISVRSASTQEDVSREPLVAARIKSNVIAWFSSKQSKTRIDNIKKIKKLSGGWRVDLATSPDEMTMLFERPRRGELVDTSDGWLKGNDLDKEDIKRSLDRVIHQRLMGSKSDRISDNLYPVAYWYSFDSKHRRWVPSGIVAPNKQSVVWTSSHHEWESAAEDHNESAAGAEMDPNPVTRLKDIGSYYSGSWHERVLSPIYVRATNAGEAIGIALVNQKVNRAKALNSEESRHYVI